MAYRPETPIDALDYTCMMSLCLSILRNVPGEVVLKMPEEERKLLRQLKSEDLAKVRPDAIFSDVKLL